MAEITISIKNALSLDGTAYGNSSSTTIELNEALESTVDLTTTFKVLFDDTTFGGIGALRVCGIINLGDELVYVRLLNRGASRYMPFAVPVGAHYITPIKLLNTTDSTMSFVSQVAARTATSAGRIRLLLGFA